MKIAFSILFILTCLTALAATNVLELTWIQPPGYGSTLYSSTNLSGSWSPLGVVTPPVDIDETNPFTLFYVSVAPSPGCAVFYDSDPNVEGVKPFPTNGAAFAYSINAALPTYYWNPTNQNWQ